MSQQQQPIGAASGQDGADVPLSHGGHSVRAARRSGGRSIALSFGTFSLGTLALGALAIGAAHVDPERTAHAAEALSATWTHLLETVHLQAIHLRADAERPLEVAGPRAGAGPAPSAVPEASPQQSAIAYGDRLKISFFESLDVALGGSARDPAMSAVGTIFPRMDLSGEYVVDETGEVDIPRLGRFAAAGHGVGALGTRLGEAFQRTFGRPSNVHVAVLDRQPVYVLGGASGGATVKHAPGMIVLQALAEAGGYRNAGSDTSRAIEAIRETQRLGETEDRLARALVRQARLIALRDGVSEVTLPPATAARLARMLSKDAVAALLADATTALGMERRAHAEQLVLADRLVGIAQGDVAAQRLRVTQAKALAQSKAARLRELEKIAANGSVSQFKLKDAGVEVEELAARQEDLIVAAAQAESRQAEAEIARAKILEAHTAQIARDLAAIEQEVGDLTRTAASVRSVIAVLGDGAPAQDGTASAQGGARAGRPALRIVRRVAGRTLLLPAAETTPLLPGDVLQIAPAEPAPPQAAPSSGSHS